MNKIRYLQLISVNGKWVKLCNTFVPLKTHCISITLRSVVVNFSLPTISFDELRFHGCYTLVCFIKKSNISSQF